MHYFILRVYSKFMPMLFDITPYRPSFFNHVFAEMTWDMGPNLYDLYDEPDIV